mgnify:FL=1|tara:strand:- start:44 stop:598 length:555 start_codon:yes stop_codon:yes gene_type:complete
MGIIADALRKRRTKKRQEAQDAKKQTAANKKADAKLKADNARSRARASSAEKTPGRSVYDYQSRKRKADGTKNDPTYKPRNVNKTVTKGKGSLGPSESLARAKLSKAKVVYTKPTNMNFTALVTKLLKKDGTPKAGVEVRKPGKPKKELTAKEKFLAKRAAKKVGTPRDRALRNQNKRLKDRKY